jgi:hypothetical protein
MKLEELLNRVDELVKLGNEVLTTKRQGHTWPIAQVDSGKQAEFRSASLSFLMRTFGHESPYYKDFTADVAGVEEFRTRVGIGILTACRAEIAGGWLFTMKGLVSAELFSDFLQMAKHLLAENYKDPAAVMVGSILEEHLRQLCGKNSIPIESTKPDGSVVSLKADALNSELAKANVYSKLDLKNVTAWLDLRNKAAHGKYAEYTKDQVDLMLRGVSDFISRTPL